MKYKTIFLNIVLALFVSSCAAPQKEYAIMDNENLSGNPRMHARLVKNGEDGLLVLTNVSRSELSIPSENHFTSDMWEGGYGTEFIGANIHLTYFDSCKPRNDALAAFKIGDSHGGLLVAPTSRITLEPGQSKEVFVPLTKLVVLEDSTSPPACLAIEARYSNYWSQGRSEDFVGWVRTAVLYL